MLRTSRSRSRVVLALLATVLACAVAALLAPTDTPRPSARVAQRPPAPQRARTPPDATVAVAGGEARPDRRAIAEQSFPDIPSPRPVAIENVPSVVAEKLVAPAHELEVLVLSPTGIPQPSIPLAFTLTDVEGKVGRSWSIGRTGEDGAALRIRDLDAVFADADAEAENALYVEVDSLVRGTARTKIEPKPAGCQTIRLTLPPAGAVEVALRGSRGPIESEAFVILVPIDLPDSERVGGDSRPNAKGGVVFERVPLGWHFKLAAHSRTDPFSTIEIAGPTAAGEVVKAELVVDDARRLRGRLVDSKRRVLPARASASLTIAPFDETKKGRMRMPPLAADGTFDLAWTELEDTGPVDLRIQARSYSKRFRERTVALPWPIPLGITDLGEIVCDEFPFLASGRVIDRNGEPIGGAIVHCFVGKQADDPATSATTDSNGRFSLYADPPREPVVLRAGRHAFTPSPQTVVEVGATDVVLQLGFTGRLHGSLVAPSNAEPAHFEIAYVSSEGTRFRGKIEHDWTFAIDWLHEGRGRLEIRSAPETPLRVIEDLASIPGEPKHDARLDGIILTTLARTIEIRASDRAGQAISDFEVQVGAGGDRFSYCPRVTQSGRGKRRLVLPIAGHDLRLGVEARFANILYGVVGDRDVTIEEAPAQSR